MSLREKVLLILEIIAVIGAIATIAHLALWLAQH